TLTCANRFVGIQWDVQTLLMPNWLWSFCLQGAFWGLAIGLTVGCIRMLLDFIYPAPLCFEEDDRPSVLKYVHYLYFSMLLSFITLGVVVVVSLGTEEPSPEQVTLDFFPYFSLTLADSASSVSSAPSQSRFISAIYWLCGMERRQEADSNTVTPPAPEQIICTLDEKPNLRHLVNSNLIICLSVTVFIIGYWA
ncbi:hypothetical protein XENOCAPTIV_030339, partial [Xenoophorus captivus]